MVVAPASQVMQVEVRSATVGAVGWVGENDPLATDTVYVALTLFATLSPTLTVSVSVVLTVLPAVKRRYTVAPSLTLTVPAAVGSEA
jgi:hypothetical protein